MVVNMNYEDVKTQITDLIEAAMRGDKVVITKMASRSFSSYR
jgi:antitoxin (DNA-binding transcriptional repressor) of toxin-antitoxin stability system